MRRRSNPDASRLTTTPSTLSSILAMFLDTAWPKERYMPQQNDVAQRKNRTITEAARTILEEKHIPKAYWVEAIRVTIYLQNRTLASGPQVSLHELDFGHKLLLAHLRVFGNIAYVHVLDEKRGTWMTKPKSAYLSSTNMSKRVINAITPNQRGASKPRCCFR